MSLASLVVPNSPKVGWNWSKSAPNLCFDSRSMTPRLGASVENECSLPVKAVLSNELEAVSMFSEIVPDTVVFDDFKRFPVTAATVSSSLLLGICSLPGTPFKSAIDTALAGPSNSFFFDKALVHVGAEMVKMVPGRVSTEVNAQLAYDTQGIVRKVHDLLRMYNELNVSSQRLLFRIPSTWQGIEASRLLESEGIQTHLTFVYCFSQAAAAAQAGASVIQIFMGRIRDWARHHSGDSEIEASTINGDDPGLALIKKTYNYINKHGYKSKLLAAAVRNKQDVFSLLGIDYIIAPVKVMQSLNDSVIDSGEKYSYVRRLSPSAAKMCNFTEEELEKWNQITFASSLGPAAEQLLHAGLEGYIDQTRRVEEHLAKIWPPPNV